MSGASCPACGVAVVPGYIKCPKCRALLPRVTFRQRGNEASGTALLVEGRSWLPFAIAGVVIVGVLVWLGMRHGSANAASAGSGIADEPVVAPTFAPTARPAAVAPTPDPVAPAPAPTAPSGPPPAEVARQLKDSLDRQRLWATVSIVGGALEVRSASCADPAMASTLDGASANAHAAGLSQLRCVSRSGAVVSTRAL